MSAALKKSTTEALLRAALVRKQASRPDYSLRALARDLDISASFVSNFFSGKKRLPLHHLEKLIHLLELDIHERELLMGAMLEDQLEDAPLEFKRRANRRPAPVALEGRDVHPSTAQVSPLSQWYYLAILESFGGLRMELRSLDLVRSRLGLTEAQFSRALHDLVELGLLRTTDDGYEKVSQQTYFAAGRSKADVRRFHSQMIDRAKQEMMQKTSEADFHRRLITGFTLTLDDSRVEEFKVKLLAFLDDFSKDACREEGTDVYQCNVQFFPLTTKRD